MQILYFAQYFSLPDEPGGSRAYQFARAWVECGHSVTVITGNVNYNTLHVHEGSRGKISFTETIDGVRVIRVWVYSRTRGSIQKRYVNFLSYAVTATLVGLFRGGRADIVYATSTPLTAGIPGYLNALFRRIPFVFEIRDLWPESAVVAGALPAGSFITRFAQSLACFLYARAAHMVAVTQGIVDGLLLHAVPPERVLLAPNGVDDWIVNSQPLPPPSESEAFRIVYAGAHGMWNGLEQILDAAAILRDQSRIEFLFIGDGERRDALIERAQTEGLDHVRFLGPVPKREAFRLLQEASASIIVTWDHPFQKMILANKLFDYLAAGRPTIVAAVGEMEELVREADAGIVVPPGRPDLLADAILRLARLAPEDRQRLGENGRRYVIKHCQRRHLADRILQVFTDVIRKRGSTR